MTEDSVEIDLVNNVLTISGEKRDTREGGESGGKFHLVERTFGSFRRSFTLPRTVRADGITGGSGWRRPGPLTFWDRPPASVQRPHERDGLVREVGRPL